MKGVTRKSLCAVLTAALLISGTAVPGVAEAKKAKVKINKKKLALVVGQKKKLKVTGTKKKAKWSSSNKKVATVTKKGVVKAKKKGSAKITAKIGKKKYTCKLTVKKATAKSTPKPTANTGIRPGGTSTPNSTSSPGGTDPSEVTGTPGRNIPIDGDVFSIGTSSTHEYQLALDLTTDQVNIILGTLSTDMIRTEKSPQGFDVIAFRENGNNSAAALEDKWGTYILLYMKDGKVAGICAIAGTMSYADIVRTGTTADTLAGDSNWSSVDWYTAGDGRAGAYAKTASDGARVLAFVDSYGDKTTYCIQVFSSEYTVETMTNTGETEFVCEYTTDVLTAMKNETRELINAYRVYYGMSPMVDNANVRNTAQALADNLKAAGVTDASSAARDSATVQGALKSTGIDFGEWAEHILIGNMDAIAFMNSAVESEKARMQLWNKEFRIMGLGAENFNDGSFNYPYLVIDFIDYVRNS